MFGSYCSGDNSDYSTKSTQKILCSTFLPAQRLAGGSSVVTGGVPSPSSPSRHKSHIHPAKTEGEAHSTMKPSFVGGALSFKGDKKKAKKKKKKDAKHSLKKDSEEEAPQKEEHLTDAERKALKRRKERERLELEKAAQLTHRERIEEFNEKLGSLTELNDMPRVSAAGNQALMIHNL